MPKSSVDDLLAEHEASLVEELRRVRAARAVLRGDQAPTTPSAGPRRAGSRGTLEMVAELFESAPDKTFTATEVNDHLKTRGVGQESKDPVNSVRGALSRLAKRGLIEDVHRGVYRLRPTPTEDVSTSPSPEQLDDDDHDEGGES